MIHTRKIFFVFLLKKGLPRNVFSINAQQQTIFRLERWVFFSSFIRLSFIFRGLANFADRFPAAINPSKWMSSNNNGGERAWHALCFFFLLNPFFYIHGHKRVDEERFFFVKKLFFCLFVVFTIFRDVDISPVVLL